MAHPTVVPFDIRKQLSIVKKQKQGIFKTNMSIEGSIKDTWTDFDVTLLKLCKLQLYIFLKSTGILKP